MKTDHVLMSQLRCGKSSGNRSNFVFFFFTIVLKQSTEWVEEVEEDENGESKTTRFTRPRLDVMVGPVSSFIIDHYVQWCLVCPHNDSCPMFLHAVLADVGLCDVSIDFGSFGVYFVHSDSW